MASTSGQGAALARAAPSVWSLWIAAVAGLGGMVTIVTLALLGEVLARPSLQALLYSWITVPYLISGLLAWWRRPASRLGPLMIATSYVMALTALQWSSVPVLYSLGHLLDMVPAAMFVHVFMAFPTGRLEGRLRKAIVVSCYAAAAGLQVVKVLLGVSPDNLLAATSQPVLATRIEQIQLGSLSVLLLISAVVLLFPGRTGRPRRRAVRLLVDAFALSLAMLAILYIAALASWPYIETIRHITFVALGLAPIAFLFGLLDARLARADVGSLLIELRADPTGDLRIPLARALHDPSLTITYWLPQYGTWADPDGRPVTLPESAAGRALRVIRRSGEPVVALEFDRSLEDERELLDGVAAAAGIALENSRLQAELRARLHELEGSRVRVLEAGHNERRRLERDLHDGAQQRLVALALELGIMAGKADPETKRRLMTAKQEVAASLSELRDVARGIYPAVLIGHGLAVALESLVAQAAVPTDLRMDTDERLPEPVEVAAYYVVSESLTNIAKHARATTATVHVSRAAGDLVVEVTDDGIGGADTGQGSGLRGLADRVEALGGRLRIDSPSGHGTRLEAVIPCG